MGDLRGRRNEAVGTPRTFTIITLQALLLFSAVASADYEGVAFGVEEYDSVCGGSDLLYTINAAGRFRDALDDLTTPYDTTAYYTNAAVDARDFADHSAYSWGADNAYTTGTDWADVAFFGGHGGRSCTDDYGWIVMGDDDDTCTPWVSEKNSGSGPHMHFADGGANEELNVLVLHAAHQLQHCIFEQGNYFDTDDGGSGTQFTTILGYHGSVNDESSDPEDVYDYVRGAQSNGIGDDWVDLTDLPAGSNNDECHVSMILGDNFSEADDMHRNGGYRDFKDTGVHDTSWYFFICDCDPPAGEVMNFGSCP